MFGKKKEKDTRSAAEKRADFRLDVKSQIRKLDKSLDKLQKKLDTIREEAIQAKQAGNKQLVNRRALMIKTIMNEMNKIDGMKNQLEMVMVNLELADVSKVFVESVAGLKDILSETSINNKEVAKAVKEMDRFMSQVEETSNLMEEVLDTSEIYSEANESFSEEELNELLGLGNPTMSKTTNQVKPVKSMDEMKRQINKSRN